MISYQIQHMSVFSNEHPFYLHISERRCETIFIQLVVAVPLLAPDTLFSPHRYLFVIKAQLLLACLLTVKLIVLG